MMTAISLLLLIPSSSAFVFSAYSKRAANIGHSFASKCRSKSMTSMVTAAQLNPVIIPPQEGNHDSTIVFLHGSGDSGQGISEALGHFGIAPLRTKIICPTAPFRKFSLFGDAGAARVWFDRVALSPAASEDRDGIHQMGQAIRELIDTEVQSGTPLSRIILGGFSMGGCQALCTALADAELSRSLAGVLMLSSFLPDDSALFPQAEELLASRRADGARSAPILICHGRSDSMIPVAWGRKSVQQLQSIGIEIEWKEYDGLDHELGAEEMADVKRWISARLPAM